MSSSATRTQRAFEVREQIGRVFPGAQVHAQAADDVADVSLAFAQVGILRLVEERGDFGERPLERRLRRSAARCG